MAEVGWRVNGLSFMFDLVNACSFKCPSCPVGNLPKRDGEVMDFDKFTRILDIIEAQVKIRNVLLYSFSEPFLYPLIAEAVDELKHKRQVPRVMISTNLSRPKNIEKTMAAGLDELRISFSGFENGEYFHRGRKMSQFVHACNDLALLVPKYKTRVGLIWHRYRTNLHEAKAIKEFARVRGFDLIPETAFFIPFETILSGNYTKADRDLIGHLIMPPEEKLKRQERDQVCYYQQKQMVIDAHGQVYLCRHVFGKQFEIGNIETDSIRDLRKRMAEDSFCVSCKNHGLNKYTEPDSLLLGQQ
jgi:MoaA/NifB/PqqE/SkfB family radical SAM enzyme